MLSYCLKCRKNTDSKNPKVDKIKKARSMVSSKYALFDSNKSRFIKEQEVSELSKILGLKISLSNSPILGDIFLKK